MARTLVRPILCVLRRGAVVLLSLRECEVRRAIARGSVCEECVGIVEDRITITILDGRNRELGSRENDIAI